MIKKTETLINNEIEISNTGNRALQKIEIKVGAISKNNCSEILGLELIETNINSSKEFFVFQ